MTQIIRENSSPSEVAEIFNVSRESLEKLKTYAELLMKWQKQINLVGPKEVPRLWSRHIADALQLIKFIPQGVTSAVDLGSGAGIPGLIVAAALGRENFHIHLVESNGKKAAFLRAALRDLEISGDVHCARIESLYEDDWTTGLQLVFARALAPLPKLLDLSVPFLKNSGKMLFMKGLDVDSELTETTKYWNIGYEKHPSRTHVGGCILNIKDFRRVSISKQN